MTSAAAPPASSAALEVSAALPRRRHALPAAAPVIGITTPDPRSHPGRASPLLGDEPAVCAGHGRAGRVPWIIPLMPDDQDTMRAHLRAVGRALAPGRRRHRSARRYGESRQRAVRHDRSRSRSGRARCSRAGRWKTRSRVLGVCRGMQLVNVAAGGTLYQDLATAANGSDQARLLPAAREYPRDHLVHEVPLAEGLAAGGPARGAGCEVNSMHHQGIKSWRRRWSPTRHAPDGLVEGLESGERTLRVRGAVASRSPGRTRSSDESTLRCLHRRLPVSHSRLSKPPVAPLTQPLRLAIL